MTGDAVWKSPLPDTAVACKLACIVFSLSGTIVHPSLIPARNNNHHHLARGNHHVCTTSSSEKSSHCINYPFRVDWPCLCHCSYCLFLSVCFASCCAVQLPSPQISTTNWCAFGSTGCALRIFNYAAPLEC